MPFVSSSTFAKHLFANIRIALVHALPIIVILVTAVPTSALHTDCSDGVDNDRDGQIDYPVDEQCASTVDDSEGPTGEGLFVEVTDGKDAVRPGGGLVYRIALRSDRDEQHDVTVRFHLPHQTNLRDASNGGRLIGTEFLQWDKVTVGGGKLRTLIATVDVNPYATANLLLVAEVEAEGESDTDTTRVTDEVLGVSPIHISVTDGKKTTYPGDLLHYDITVRNVGTGDRVFVLRTSLPEGLGFISATKAFDRRGTSVEWRSEALHAGETKSYAIDARVEARLSGYTHLRLRAYGNAPGEIGTDDTYIHVGPEEQDFTISVDADADGAAPGEEITYTIEVQNRSDLLGTEVNVADALPIYTEFVSATEGGRFMGGSEVRWDGLTVSPHGARTLQVTARVRSDAPIGAVLLNSAVVGDARGTFASHVSTEGGRSSRPSRATDDKVFLRKVADRPEVRPGDVTTYTIYIRNTTGQLIHDVEVDDRLDGQYMTLVRGADDAQKSGNHLHWTIQELSSGEVWQRRYSVRISEDVPHGVSLNNIVSVGGDDIASLSLTERVRTTDIAVFEEMPSTGAGFDGAVAFLSSFVSILPAMAQRRRWLTAL